MRRRARCCMQALSGGSQCRIPEQPDQPALVQRGPPGRGKAAIARTWPSLIFFRVFLDGARCGRYRQAALGVAAQVVSRIYAHHLISVQNRG